MPPPCGTASKARDKPLPSYMEHIKAEPLRSELHPLGLPSLQGLDWTRTQAANHLYAFTLLCTFVMVLRGAIVSVENPSSSYLWLVMYQFCQQNEKLMAMWLALEQVHFQACMHGSDRDKWTCWYSTKDVFASIRARCDNSHTHKSWKPTLDANGKPVFPTASEAAYPKPLCDAVTRAVVAECAARGVSFRAEAFQPTLHAENQTISSKRGHKSLPPLVAEYLVVTDVQPQNCDFKSLDRIPFEVKNGVEVENTPFWEELEWKCFRDNRGTELRIADKSAKKFFAVYRNPKQFVDAALTCKHPIDYAFPLPDQLLRAVANVVNDGPKLTDLKRKLMVKKIARRVVELRDKEQQLHQQLDPEVEVVLRGKNLLIWKELMEQTSFADECIFDEMKSGFKLCGQANVSGAFPLGHQPAQQSVDELRKQAKWLRASVIGKCKPFDGGDLDQVTWDKTIKERDLGWISGPYSLSEMEQLMEGQPWIVTRRFPLQQKDKVRLIDDCLSSGLNSAYSSANKLRLMAVDSLVLWDAWSRRRA